MQPREQPAIPSAYGTSMFAAPPLPPSNMLPNTKLLERACTAFDLAAAILGSAALDITSGCAPVTHAREAGTTLTAKSERKEGKRRRKALHEGATVSLHFPPAPEQRQRRKRRKVLAEEPEPEPEQTIQLDEVAEKEQGEQQKLTKTKTKTKKKKATARGPTTSPFFPQALSDPFSRIPTPRGLSFELQPAHSSCHLIQERICGDLFAVILQAILWNRTRGTQARPILWELLCHYPTAEALAAANVDDIERIIRTLGLQRERAKRLVDMAAVWVASPPSPERRYQRRHYPSQGHGCDAGKGAVLDLADARDGWEIAHLPGVGEYALDSFRIFARDRLRRLHHCPDVEPEWKRVVPRDKELAPYVRWKWAQEGWDYDIETGIRVRLWP
ncbi:DNA glycosylase [Byssothecium circinans]|uniref:DNA glycosylase n=1 Tax=Byssothecium circinans TaxID=147558 RepID=A0A6A5TAH1_9PLEO|nr:DNA glycosylase [Byssothecium circinans]